MTLPPLTVKVIEDLGASMQAASERMEKQTARIASLEETIAALNARLEAAAVAHQRERAVLAAVEALSDEQVRWFQNSGPFRHVCKAEMARRGLT